MKEQHRIRIRGAKAQGDRVSGYLLRDLLDILIEGSERALRFRIEGRSITKGTPPKWLRPAAEFSILPLSESGPSLAVIESTPVIDSMPERFRAGELFEDFDPHKTPIQLFEEALEDAIRGNEDSDRFDTGLVKTFEKFHSILAQGLDQIELLNHRTLLVDEPALDRVRQLANRSFPPQRVRLAGRLEAIRYSDCRFTIVLENGAVLQGTAVELGHEVLQKFFGQVVTLTGNAVFRPSGKPLRVEAERIDPASERERRIWSAVPRPLLAPLPLHEIREQQESKGGLEALLGKWPGDESDEQVRMVLETLS